MAVLNTAWSVILFAGYIAFVGAAEFDVCSIQPCLNGGSCVPQDVEAPYYYCACPENWSGPNCESYLGGSYGSGEYSGSGESSGSGSYSGSGDYSGSGGYYGFGGGSGNYWMSDPCSYSPCQNGATCLSNGMGRYECVCPERYYGWNCEEEIQDGLLKIEVKNCEIDNIREGESKTVAEWCAQDMRSPKNESLLSVRVVGIVMGQSYMFEVVSDYQGEETVVSREIFAAGEYITDLISDMVFSAPDATYISEGMVCNNYDAFLSMRIAPTSAPDNTTETEPRKRVTVLCDFRGVDLELTVDGDTDLITSTADGTKLAEFASAATFQLQMAAGSEALPLLGNDASYYLVAFLTKRPVKSPDMCEEDYDIPEVTFADTILWYTRFQSSHGFTNVDSELKDMDLSAPERCGEYNLVILADPLVSIVGERRCNNYIVLQAGLGTRCSAEEVPECKLIPNPFTNGRETAFSFHNHQRLDTLSGSDKPDNRMFKYRGKGTWVQEMDSEEDMMKKNMYEVNRDGYGRLKLLEKYIRNQINDGMLTCSGLDETEAMNKVKEMEGLEPDDEPVPGENFNNIVPAFGNALGYLYEMNNGYMSPEDIRNGVGPSVESLPVPHPMNTTMKEKVAYWVSKAAMYAVGNISEAMIEDRVEGLMKQALSNLCMTGDIMRRVSEMGKMKEDWEVMNLDWELMRHVENVTRSIVMMKQFLPNATFVSCMDGMFERLVKFASGELEDDRWMFENECRREENSCLRKVRNLCSNSIDHCEEETRLTDDEDFCVIRHFRGMIEREYKAVGLHDIREKLRSDQKERDRMGMDSGNCNGEDPVKPRNDPLFLYKLRDDGTVMKGEPQLNSGMICWNPVAVCTCADCGPAAKKRRRK